MISKVVFLCAAFAAIEANLHVGLINTGSSISSRQQDDFGNYAFNYGVADGLGATNSRAEVGDAHGNKKGSYTLTDIDGRARRVDYVADGLGFRAAVKTNEPGTALSTPAAAVVASPYAAPVAPVDVRHAFAAPAAAVVPSPYAAQEPPAAPAGFGQIVAAVIGQTVASVAPVAEAARTVFAQPIAAITPIAESARTVFGQTVSAAVAPVTEAARTVFVQPISAAIAPVAEAARSVFVQPIAAAVAPVAESARAVFIQPVAAPASAPTYAAAHALVASRGVVAGPLGYAADPLGIARPVGYAAHHPVGYAAQHPVGYAAHHPVGYAAHHPAGYAAHPVGIAGYGYARHLGYGAGLPKAIY